MEFSYVAYTKDKKLVKGTLSASSGEAATKLLNYGGYQVLTVKPYAPFISLGRLSSLFNRVNPREVIMFSRQLALLLESGTDIVSSLELLQAQVTSKSLKQALAEIVSDIRGGSSLSAAMKKQPKMFSSIYARAISAGEQSGNLEIVLRQMAGFIERRVTTEKKIKSALTYPILVLIVAFAVVALMVTFVLPTFTQLYTQFSAEQPLTTKMLIGLTDWLNDYGLYLLVGIFAAISAGLIYLRTPAGRYQWDKLSFKLPIMGRILLLYQLSRACRTISLLFKVGMPLPEVLSHTVRGAGNRVMAEQIQGIQDDLIRGEGLSRPMSRRSLFLPLMVQMVGVGEETGKLDTVLVTVAESYEMEADDRSSAAIGLIQPVVTIVIGLVIGFIALSLVSAMYSVYGQI
ncbi:MAG: type II secretion system F family protein [Dehalococcoidales bacterium]|nr:type II secretion system F family protein [Dehalococcoidales bacterium]